VANQGPHLIREFYGIGLDEPDALDFSHRIRWSNSGRVARFLAPALLDEVRGHDPMEALYASIPDDVRGWRPLARAQYLEVRTLLSQYLLSSQGDRMLMAHSVEGRFPFLDHRFADFSARLPDWFKLRGLTEKYLLKKYARGRVPDAVLDRPKYPYRAPISEALTGDGAPAWSRELLTREAIDAIGIFDGTKAARLVAKLAGRGGTPSEADNMALIAVATTQLLANQFLSPRSLRTDHVDAVTLQAA
jgi:asparagine synthase (glutamine-hydrolysing)